ncbi:EAL domain-containing protein [Sphingomonas populi]|uniref:EAL domain-containing protein n=1 Tax=Sphingomonas populi TaxID=2484750 RepID=A0A4Q6XTV2_9SPHN|nr:EAL domain-containing protein [Sphingomonas populi]RZF63710.1 EAL domain-containing protein [Sphingomonas populi]
MGSGHDDGSEVTLPPRQDLWIGAITVTAIVLFVCTAGAALSLAFDAHRSDRPADRWLMIALLLNVALILFGWRRHRELSSEVAAHTRAGDRAHHLAARDPLTGVLNRRSLTEEGATLFVGARRRHKAMALMMIDIDHFKAINDRHGHATGDAVLRLAAAEITRIMPSGAVLARIGSDAFACGFLFDSGHPATVERVVERTISKFAQPFKCEGLALAISASVGIARSDNGCASFEALMRGADSALHAAKHAGRNRYAWFDQALEREEAARALLETRLRGAIARQDIVPYFEQQIDLATGGLRGFEVLARWDTPDGMVAPAVFLPVAERTGLIGDLSFSVMRQAFLAARDWDAGLTLSVNLSPCQLQDAWLAQKIIKVLTEVRFPPGRLEIEVTETALFDNLALAQSILASLKNQGVRLVLDDFGSGFASLAHLHAAAFDRVKLSRSFVTALDTTPDHAVMINAVARLGECFNLPITAVGIETAETGERLRALGYTRGQGQLYAQPASIANTRRLLAQRGLLRQPGPTIANPHRAIG